MRGGANLYAYAGARPSVLTDPTGLFTLPPSNDPRFQKCRALRKGTAQRKLERARREPKCQQFFKNRCNSNLDKLFNDPLPRVVLEPETRQRPGGGYFDPANPDVIVISMRECKSMEDFAHTFIHELGHYSDFNNNNDSISDADHGDGCDAEIQCFGFTRSLNCKWKGFSPYRAPKR